MFYSDFFDTALRQRFGTDIAIVEHNYNLIEMVKKYWQYLWK